MSSQMVRIAAKAAKKSTHKSFFHGCTIKRGGSIVSTGHNMTNGAHAEEQALNKMWPDQRIGCTLISIRVTRGGLLACARPCLKCQALIKASGIKKVYFSNEHRQIEMMKL